MKLTFTRAASTLAVCLLLAAEWRGLARDNDQTPAQEFSRLIDRLARNQLALQQFCWDMHTEIIVNGRIEKISNHLCRYGPDGTVYKTPYETLPPRLAALKLRQRGVESKPDEIQRYLDTADCYIRYYAPYLRRRMNEAFNSEYSWFRVAPDSGEDEFQFTNLLTSGDYLALSVDSERNALRHVNVRSNLGNPADAFTLDVEFERLPDGTEYATSAVLKAAARQIQITIRNGNYRKMWF